MVEQAAPSRIVVGVDGSGGSRAALAWALRQAGLTGATVAACHVLRHPDALEWATLPTNYGGAPLPVTFDRDEAHASAERSLAEFVGELAGDHPVTTQVVVGHPATELLAAARDAELLVLGRQGHSGVAAALMGSVSRHCAEHATCGVVIVPPEA